MACVLFFSLPNACTWCVLWCFSYLIMSFFSLWPAAGLLHFHPDNVCSEDRDKVSMTTVCCLCFAPGLNRICMSLFLYSFSLLSVLFVFPWPTTPWVPPPLHLCADGRQPEPEKAAPYSAVHVGFKPRPSHYSFLSYSSLGASSQSQTTPPLRAWEMPHASSQPTKVDVAQIHMIIFITNLVCRWQP